jgi:hypothetical protein
MGRADCINLGGSKLADMAITADVFKWHFNRICKEISGQNPARYLKRQSVTGNSTPTALRSSAGGEVESPSGGNRDSRLEKWHASRCNAELYLAGPVDPCYALPESVDTDQFNESVEVLWANWKLSDVDNFTLPSFWCGFDLPDFI